MRIRGDTLKIRISELDNKTIIVEIEDHDDGPVVDALETRGHGYAVYGEDIGIPMMVVDGRLLREPWFTQDHMWAIEAHELGHIMTNSEDESTAEREGIKILQIAGLHSAAELLVERGII
jgi:hypothetical protein